MRNGDPSQDVAVATVVFLVDGKLVMLQPSRTEDGDAKYDMRTLQQNVEYYALMREHPLQQHFLPSSAEQARTPTEVYSPGVCRIGEGLSDSLWLFDGTDMRVWGDVQEILEAPHGEGGKEIPVPVKIGVDFYPMSTLLGKGIILGIESELVQRRDINFSYFKFATRVCQKPFAFIWTCYNLWATLISRIDPSFHKPSFETSPGKPPARHCSRVSCWL